MALPDNYTGANVPAKTSRFSSLKVFGKFSKEKESLKPPPPPPKDTYYLNNRSLVSLHYPQEFIPPTPSLIGTAYAASSNTMGPSKSQYAASVHSKKPTNPTSSSLSLESSVSLVSSPSDIGSSSQQQQQSQPSLPKSSAQKISGLFKFRRGTKSPSERSGIVDDEIMSLQSTGDDENISTPWNFQHNIHVDDALTGLPPSWTVTLAKAGFTEEEIAAIYARKQAGTLTPGNELPYPSYGYDRPRSPAISIASSAASSSLQRPGTAASSGSLGSSGVSPLLAHPLPRSTSLPRSQSNLDNRQTIVASPARIYSPSPNPAQQQPKLTHADRSRNNSTTSIPLSVSVSASETGRMRPNLVAVQGDEEASGAFTLPEHRRNRSGSNHSRQPSRAASVKSNRKESPRIQPPQVPVGAPSSQPVSPTLRPSTPPRRAYFVANGNSPMMQTPPPSYSATEGIHSSALGQAVGPNGYPLEKSDANGRTATGLRHQNQRSTDTTRSGSSQSQKSPSRSSSTRSPQRPQHQHSYSSASLQSSGSSHSDGEGLRRSISSNVGTSRNSKRRSKRSFNGLGGGLNLSLDLGTGLESWSESLFSEIDTTKSAPSQANGPKPVSPYISPLVGISNTAGNRDTIKPLPQDHRSVMDRPRPKPPAPVAGIPPRVHIIADSPVSSASPSTTTFTPSPSASTFQHTTLSTPSLKSPWSFGEGELGVEQDPQQTFPVSPGYLSDYAPSINSISPRTGLFDEIAGMVGIRLDDEEHRDGVDLDRDRLSPAVDRTCPESGRGGHGPALSENSPTIPLSPPYAANGHGNPSAGWNRTSAYRIPDGDRMKWTGNGDDNAEDDKRQIEEGDDGEDGTWLTTGGNASNRNSSRSSTSTVSTLTVTHLTATTTSVRAAVAKIEKASAPRLNASALALKSPTSPVPGSRRLDIDLPPAVSPPSGPPPPPPPTRSKSPVFSIKHPASPQESTFGSEEGSGTAGSVSCVSSSSRFSGSSSVAQLSPTTENEDEGDELVYYLDGTYSPGPGQTTFGKKVELHEHHHLLTSATDTFGGVIKESEIFHNVSLGDDEDSEDDVLSNNDTISHATTTAAVLPKPTIVISTAPIQPGPVTAAMLNSALSPITPAQRYPGWLSEVLKPLEEFIDESIEPRDYYFDLQEIAEGESGSVFAARVTETGNIHKLKLPPLIKAQNADNQMRGTPTVVAIKCVQIVPTGSTKLEDLRGELTLLKGLSHPNILTMDALYVDLSEDSLWIRMELMERSLADVVELADAGLMLQERMIARFTSDIVEALQFLQSHRIAHRDLRSDNLLLNSEGILKLTDFSYALKLPKETPMAFDPVGVLYWQAPEVRTGPYDALKVDVWSLGATVWEMAQARPPFADAEDEESISNRWPPLDKPDLYSPAFHDFLRLCSEPASSRPSPSELLKNPFVKNSCGRPVIHQLLQQCMSIEQAIQANEDNDS